MSASVTYLVLTEGVCEVTKEQAIAKAYDWSERCGEVTVVFYGARPDKGTGYWVTMERWVPGLRDTGVHLHEIVYRSSERTTVPTVTYCSKDESGKLWYSDCDSVDDAMNCAASHLRWKGSTPVSIDAYGKVYTLAEIDAYLRERGYL